MSPQDRERQIVTEAVRFFAEHGFGGQTRELARRIGITQPLLYRYFPNKGALIERVYQEVFLGRWNPLWEGLLGDRGQPLERRLVTFYQQYARAILTYDWTRIFLLAGLGGLDINARYLSLVRDRILRRILAEARHDMGLPPPESEPLTELELELAWGLHGSVFYSGIRRWIYGLEVPDNMDIAIEAKVAGFLEALPRVLARFTLVGRRRAIRRA